MRIVDSDRASHFIIIAVESPPRSPKKGSKSRQSELPGQEDHEERTSEFIAENGPIKVKYSLALTLKSDAGDTVIKFGPFEAFPEQLEDHVTKQFNSKYFRARVQAAVMVPTEIEGES